jgi:isochorismate hydrolase
MLLNVRDSVLLIVDLQPKFMTSVIHAERVVRRAEFLCRVAQILEVPVFATEQNPERMLGTDSRLTPFIPDDNTFSKMAFSAFGAAGLNEVLQQTGRSTVVIVGVETHICVNQTVHDCYTLGLTPVLVPDAVTSRAEESTETGLKRIAALGTTMAHSESVVYEWLGTADHPRFREVLAVVKEFSDS